MPSPCANFGNGARSSTTATIITSSSCRNALHRKRFLSKLDAHLFGASMHKLADAYPPRFDHASVESDRLLDHWNGDGRALTLRL